MEKKVSYYEKNKNRILEKQKLYYRKNKSSRMNKQRNSDDDSYPYFCIIKKDIVLFSEC